MSKGKKLLLADDSVTIQKVVNLTFADEGIEVIAVGDGDAAMEKFVEFAPDLLMVDVNMPGADGYKICEMIKQDEETAHIPVILLVGSFEPFDEEEAHRVGADAYLTKPFQSIRQLVGKVTALLDSSFTAADKTGFVGETVSDLNEEIQTFESSDSKIYAESNSNGNYEDNFNAAAPRFDDAETDDETIQTNQIGSLPADEAQRFSADFPVEGSSRISAGEPFENSFSYKSEAEDWAKTQPLTAEESSAANFVSDEYETAPLDAEIYEAADEQIFQSENTDSEKSENIKTAAATQNFSWDFDELNLLELPYDEDGDKQFNNQETADKNEPEIAETETDKPDAQESVVQEPAAAAPPQINISPELIEQIAARVAEKLSDKVIGAITREFVPQMSDLIAKELAQEELEK